MYCVGCKANDCLSVRVTDYAAAEEKGKGRYQDYGGLRPCLGFGTVFHLRAQSSINWDFLEHDCEQDFLMWGAGGKERAKQSKVQEFDA